MIHEETIKAVEFDGKRYDGAKLDGSWRHVTRVDYFPDDPYPYDPDFIPEPIEEVTFHTFEGGSWSGHGGKRDSFTLDADADLEVYFDDGCCKHGTYVGGMGVDLMCHWCEGGYTDEEMEAHAVNDEHIDLMAAYDKEIFEWVIGVCSEVGGERSGDIFDTEVMDMLKSVSKVTNKYSRMARR